MASPCSSSRSRTCLLHGIQVSITVAFIFSLTLLLLLPAKSGLLQGTERDVEESGKVIGSKPPSCVNKCMKCRPCLATLVAPDHQRKKEEGFKVSSRGEDDDTYYLLSWKCSCGNKLFHP
ncbi:EPIDERMAL PATTERNING FACTOR-like protein 8 [Prosopis cineraria]|uniref:EPIDERMAL PATTERNING FACTOR-like protein 8 n=1 Tax=Prosopis cineraria TaxID=364024 RepID=UPI00241093A9|nr:EPIDERMAL PATTERNING FACTOR-like protein 8 [Prosopis cineraria]